VPVRIDVGDQEVLLDDSVRYAEKIANAGLSVSFNVWEECRTDFKRSVL
jgi:acetyl esterase/lipase